MILINFFEQGLGHIWPGIFTKRNTRSRMFETLLERSIKIILVYIIKSFKTNEFKGKKFKIQNFKFEF